MAYEQTTRVTPNIACKPGWCLQYVQGVFNAPWSGATATQGWNLTKHKHKNDKFPNDVAVPVWFSMKGEPAGHVAVRMKDGSYYSTSHPTSNKPTHHPNLQHLLDYYGGRLKLRGWSEDMNGYKVIKEKESKEMITKFECDYAARARLGDGATDKQVKEWTKKFSTLKELDNYLLTTKAYKDKLAAMKKTKQFDPNQLLKEFRAIWGIK